MCSFLDYISTKRRKCIVLLLPWDIQKLGVSVSLQYDCQFLPHKLALNVGTKLGDLQAKTVNQ